MKTDAPKIFTEDLTKYEGFIRATNEGLLNAVRDMNQQIEIRNRVIELIRKDIRHEPVSMKDMAELARTSCPDFHSLDTLIDLIEKFNIRETLDYISASAYKQSIDCSKVSCAECWRNYINQTAHIINMSPIDVKNYDIHKDDDK